MFPMQRNCDIANSNKFQIKFLTYSNKQVTQFSMQWLCDKFFLPNAIRLASLVVAVISVEAYPFLAFSDLTCHLEDTEIGVFWLHCAA